MPCAVPGSAKRLSRPLRPDANGSSWLTDQVRSSCRLRPRPGPQGPERSRLKFFSRYPALAAASTRDSGSDPRLFISPSTAIRADGREGDYLASIDDVPADLLPLARVISPLTMALMDKHELILRLQYTARLTGLADLSDESEAKRLRRLARKHLESPSLSQLKAAVDDLQDEISAAQRDGNDSLVLVLGEQLEALERSAMTLPDEYLSEVALAGLTEKYKHPAAKRRRWPRLRRNK